MNYSTVRSANLGRFNGRIAQMVAGLTMLLTLSVSATTVNEWTGPSGGSWGTDSNWSLGHKPTETEIFDYTGTTPVEIVVDNVYTCGCWLVNTYNASAQITLKGTGSVTALGTGGHYNKKPLVLDGVTLEWNGKETLLYADLTLKNGAKLKTDGRTLHSWGNKAYIDVQDGEISCGMMSYASTPSKFHVGKGRISCTDFAPYSYTRNLSVQFTMDGGELACSGGLVLTNAQFFTMNGGAVSVGGSAQVLANCTLNLNGGIITNASLLTVAGKRLITESKGTAFVSTSTGDAVDIIESLDEVLTFKAPFSAPNGTFLVRYRSTVVSDQPFAVRRFFIARNDAESGPLTVRIPEIVVSDAHLCWPQSKARYFYLEGPLTLRPSAAEMTSKSGTTYYVYVNGELTVDTSDYNDPTLERSMAFNMLGSKDGNASLIVKGGGTFSTAHLSPNVTFRKVEVQEGTTLEITEFTGSESGPLCAEKFVLGKNAVLKIPSGKNNFHAASWEVDPTAKIEISLPAGFATGGRSFLRDFSGQLAISASQVVLSGEGLTDDCRVVCSEGLVSVVKPATSIDGTYAKEWTGGGASSTWRDAANWYDGQDPTTELTTYGSTGIYAFGYGDTRTTSACTGGGYMGQVVFRETAVSTYSLTSDKNCSFAYPSGLSGYAKSSVYSLSAVPQNFGLRFRGPWRDWFAVYAKDGPVVLTMSVSSDFINQSSGLKVYGDVRVSGSIVWSKLSVNGATSAKEIGSIPMPYGQLTILSGGSLVLNAQTDELGAGSGNASYSFRIYEGGILEFKGDNVNSKYSWNQKPSKHVVDGQLKIGAPYYGGFDQIYGGKGVVSLAANVPTTTTTTLTLDDAVTLDVTQDWRTVATASDAAMTLRVAARGDNPTVRLSDDWTYGVPDGVEPTPEASARALTIGETSTLNVNANGHTATFADSVAGAGTLAVTNGSVCLAGDVTGLSAVRLDADGVLTGNGGFANLVSKGGAIALDAAFTPLACASSAEVSDLKLTFAEKAPARWTTVLTAPTITGTAATSDRYATRIVAVDGGKALQCKQIRGMMLYVR